MDGEEEHNMEFRLSQGRIQFLHRTGLGSRTRLWVRFKTAI